PSNPENVYVGGLNFSKSTDGGKTFKSLQQGIAHSDNHAIWINPKNGDNIMVGNDGGLDVSYDQGATWEYVNTIPAAQIDPTDYNTVYAESQGGAMQRLDLRTGRSVSIRPRGVPRRGGGRQGGGQP